MNHHIVTICLIDASLCLGLLPPLYADTVGWWRFDSLGAEGGKTTASTVFTNAVDAAKYPAVPIAFNKREIVTSDETYFPSLLPLASVSAVGAVTPRLRVCDPVADETHTISTVLSCPYAGNGTALSGGAKVTAVDTRLWGCGEGQTGDFTFECFFKTPSVTRTSLMVAIAGQLSSQSMGCWSLMVYGNRLWGRFALRNRNTGNLDYEQEQIGGSSGGGTTVTTGVWHHAAFVYSVTNTRVSLYLDYKLDSTKTIGSNDVYRIAPASESEPIYFGKSMAINDDRVLDGEFAEARISDAALTPDEFLRLSEIGCGGDRASDDPDTLGWWSLDSAASVASFFNAYPNLDADEESVRLSPVTPTSAVPLEYSAETTSAVVRAASDYSQQFANGGSALLATNNCRNSYFEVKRISALFSGSFTEEFLVKTAHRLVDLGANSDSYGLVYCSYMKFLIEREYKRFYFRFYRPDGSFVNSSTSLTDDGLWHHVAIVHDADAQVTSCYLDGKARYTVNIPLRLNTTTTHTLGYANDGSSGAQCFDGWIDEYRLTRRALKPIEFFAFNRNLADTNTLTQIACDGDFRMQPQENVPVTADIQTTGGDVITTRAPTFVAPRAPELDSFKGADDRFTNAAAAKFEGGRVVWGDLPSLRRSNVTIEFFWKPGTYFAPWPTVLGMSDEYGARTGMSDTAASATTGIPWVFYYNAAWTTAQLNFKSHVTNEVTGTISDYSWSLSPTWTFTETHKSDSDIPGWGLVSGCDGRWHHVAVSIREFVEEDVTKTEYIGYWDYQPKFSHTVEGHIYFNPNSVLEMNSHPQTKRYCDWTIDHVRISKGILTPEKFVHTSARGCAILLR